MPMSVAVSNKYAGISKCISTGLTHYENLDHTSAATGHLEVIVVRSSGISKWVMAAPFPAPWEFVKADGVIEVVANEGELNEWATDRGLAPHNVRHHLRFFTGNGESHHVGGWIVKQKLQWMRRAKRCEYVPILGGSDLFFNEIRAQRVDIDMPFTQKKLNEHLAHARKHGPSLKGYLSSFKWQVVNPPIDEEFWLGRALVSKTAPEPEPAPPSESVMPNYGAQMLPGLASAGSSFSALYDRFQVRFEMQPPRAYSAGDHTFSRVRNGARGADCRLIECGSILARRSRATRQLRAPMARSRQPVVGSRCDLKFSRLERILEAIILFSASKTVLVAPIAG